METKSSKEMKREMKKKDDIETIFTGSGSAKPEAELEVGC